MLSKAQLDGVAQNLVNLYNNLEREMLLNIAKRISSKKDLLETDPEAWQIHQLQQLGMLDKDNLNVIKKAAGLTSSEINKILYDVGVTGLKKTDDAIKSATKAGAYLKVPTPISESPIILNIMRAFQRQAKDVMNLVNQTMLIKSKQVYTDMLNRAVLDVVSGKETHDKALRNAVAEMAENGIPALVDKAGRKWGVEGYVRTVIVSTAKNTMHAMQDTRFEEFGVEYVEITSHMGARPKCAPYQGRIFQLKGNDKYPNLYTETSYGKPDGLFGINCGHRKYPFIPGVNIQRYFPYDEEENDKSYKESQVQRAHERAIRKAKTQYEMHKAAGDQKGMEEATALVKNRQSKMREFIDKTGRTRRNYREQIHTNKKLKDDYKRTGDIEEFIPKDPVAKKKTKTDIDIPKQDMKPTKLEEPKKEINGYFVGDKVSYEFDDEDYVGTIIDIDGVVVDIKNDSGTKHIIHANDINKKVDTDFKEEKKMQIFFDPTQLDDREKYIRYDSIETGFIFDQSGKEVWSSKGSKNHVDLQDAADKGYLNPGYTFTHNHPKDTSFSLPDVQALVVHGLAEMRAIGKENKHSMKLTDKYDPSKGKEYAEEIKKKYHDINSKVLKELDFKIAKKELTYDEANAINQHMVWERLVKEVDYLEYKQEKWPDSHAMDDDWDDDNIVTYVSEIEIEKKKVDTKSIKTGDTIFYEDPWENNEIIEAVVTKTHHENSGFDVKKVKGGTTDIVDPDTITKHIPAPKAKGIDMAKIEVGDIVKFKDPWDKNDVQGIVYKKYSNGSLGVESEGEVFKLEPGEDEIVEHISLKNPTKPVKGNDDIVEKMPKKKLEEIGIGDKIKFTNTDGQERIATIQKTYTSGKIVLKDENGNLYQITKDNIIEHVPEERRRRNLESFKRIDENHVDVKADKVIFSNMKKSDVIITHKYTTAYHGTMNGHLRRGENDPDVRKEVEHLHKVIEENAHAMTEDVILYRRFDSGALKFIFGDNIAKELLDGKSNKQGHLEAQENAKRMLLGGSLKDKAFVSSTYQRGAFGDYMDVELEIYTPQGFKGGMFVESISEYRTEKEYIFNSGSEFEIMDISFEKVNAHSDKMQIIFKVMPR